MSHAVAVHTIRSKGGGNSKVNEAWMHVGCDYGFVEVHTTTTLPTFLIGNEIVVYFIQFETLRSAKDYITYHQAYIDWIKVLYYDEGTVRIKDADVKEYLLDPDDLMYPGRLDKRVHDGERKIEMEELLGELLLRTNEDDTARISRITQLLRELK